MILRTDNTSLIIDERTYTVYYDKQDPSGVSGTAGGTLHLEIAPRSVIIMRCRIKRRHL